MSSILTVSQLNRYVGFKLKQDVKLKSVAVSGEIINFSYYAKSGHMYFSLSDGESSVRAVMFAGNASKLNFAPEEGMKVVVVCNAELYEKEGRYQLIVLSMNPIGEGIGAIELEKLKKKLDEMGVFAPEIKRPIPERPSEIAVVTSIEGAALQDIINVISRRCPVCRLTVFPCSVQGVNAPDEIEKALFRAGQSTADTVILARGGGSKEDLSAFNAEKVVMAVYNCSIPLISAVGHETDTSLCDYAADKRAPTPSAAAELAVPDMSLMAGDISRLTKLCQGYVKNKLLDFEQKLGFLSSQATAFSPKNRLENVGNKLSAVDVRLNKAYFAKVSALDISLMECASKLSALSPFNVLERGYTLVTRNDELVRSAGNLNGGDIVKIKFADGEISAAVCEKE